MSDPSPWVDREGYVHRPLLRVSSDCFVLASEVIEALDSARDDPNAFIRLEWMDRWGCDYYVLVHCTDQSDTYCI